MVIDFYTNYGYICEIKGKRMTINFNNISLISDLVFDVRFLPNPFYIDELKYLSGNDEPVKDYVMGFAEAHEFLDKLQDMLEFLMSAPFQVLIMGHSCGNSDRTLLNTVFEHENCVSIKPFYHKWEDGSDNYLELVQNISRNFTNMRLFRDRVVNKEQCKTM